MKSPKRADIAAIGETSAPDNSLPLTYYLLVVLGASSRSLKAMAANYWQLVHPERILLVTGIVAGLSCLALWTLVKLGVRRKVALGTVLTATVLFIGGGTILRGLGSPLGWLAVIGAVILAVLIARTFSETVVRGISVILVVALVSVAFLSGYDAVRSMGSDNTVDSTPVDLALGERPDIYLVFLDAYPGFQALTQVLDTSKDELILELENAGFQLPTSSWTGYASTEMAIPSVLDMSYPVTPPELTSAGRQALHETIAGDNQTLELLEANGYQTTMIESGWVGSSCGPQFDECIASHPVDEVMYHLASETLVYRLVLERFGHAFTANSIHTIDRLEEVASRTDGDDPRFVFAHVLAPHPPFFLDETCATTVDDVRVTQSFTQEPADDVWDALFVEQTRCVDRWIGDLLDAVSSDDVVLLLGDHGIGRQPAPSEASRPPDNVVLEHQNVFLAAAMPDDCTLTDPILTSDLMRQLFSCLGGSSLQPVEQRMFVWGGYEMSPDEIEELIGTAVTDG